MLLQDFTGVPAVVDLAAMRDAMAAMGGDPAKINPLQPAEMVIDHSVQVDAFGTPDALAINTEKEYERNRERYMLLRWAQGAFDNFRVVPPATGIVHQVNIEYLARVIFGPRSTGTGGLPRHARRHGLAHDHGQRPGCARAGASAASKPRLRCSGQPVSLLVPQVVGFKLVGDLAAGATATDLVLRVVEMLRERGVVGKFVEFFGPGLADLSLADRATLANMAPEYGATCGIFPIDEQTLDVPPLHRP